MKTLLILSALFFAFAGSASFKQNQCLELRLYQLMPHKTEAVLARFRDHVDPLFRKHGLTPLGFWIAKDSVIGDSFIYILSAPSLEDNKKSMAAFAADPQFQEAYKLSEEANGRTVQKIESWFLDPINDTYDWSLDQSRPHTYELRMYTTHVDLGEKFIKRWEKSAVPLYKKHGLSSVGGWTTKQDAVNNMVFWMLIAGNTDQIVANKDVFPTDPASKKAKKNDRKKDTLTKEVRSFILTPTDFSPAK